MAESKDFVIRCARSMYNIRLAWGVNPQQESVQKLLNLGAAWRLEALDYIQFRNLIKSFDLYCLEADTAGTIDGSAVEVACPVCKYTPKFRLGEDGKFNPVKTEGAAHLVHKVYLREKLCQNAVAMAEALKKSNPGEVNLVLILKATAASAEPLLTGILVLEQFTENQPASVQTTAQELVKHLTERRSLTAVPAECADGSMAAPKSGCFIATAVFGVDSGEVAALRSFRDRRLNSNALGRLFISLYYLASPAIANMIGKSSSCRAIVDNMLRPIVWLVRKF